MVKGEAFGMKHISELTKEDMAPIKLIVFDVDGVLVPRGTRINQNGNTLTLETKVIQQKQIDQIMELCKLGFYVNIASGRSLSMLMEMFRPVLDYVSITFENGSASWAGGTVIQHVNSFPYLGSLYKELRVIKDSNIKGFEPKEHIITLHAFDRIPEVDSMIDSLQERHIYCIWNGEAYDFGVMHNQTKGIGVGSVMEVLKIRKQNVMAIGDNLNDVEMLKAAGISVTADKTRVDGDFWVPLDGILLPADELMQQIIQVLGG